MTKRHNITLDAQVSKELQELADELGEKKNYIIEKALTLFFDTLDLKIAQKRLKELKKGKSKVYEAEEVWKKLGIE